MEGQKGTSSAVADKNNNKTDINASQSASQSASSPGSMASMNNNASVSKESGASPAAALESFDHSKEGENAGL